jgi:hypothetical protein
MKSLGKNRNISLQFLSWARFFAKVFGKKWINH